jgi:hypothetical protein
MLLTDNRIKYSTRFTNGLIPFEEKQNDGSFVSKKVTYESLFGSISLPLILLFQTGTIPIDLPANSYLVKVFVKTTAGTPSINITDGGEINFSELVPSDVGYVDLTANQFYPSDKTLTITITGGSASIRVELILNYC